MVPRITEVVSATEGLKTLSEALIVSGIDETLSAVGPYTLFAPTEDAFSEIGVDALVALAANREDLAHTLRTHIVAGTYLLSDLADIERLQSIAGTELFISVGEDDEAYVEEARIVRGDIDAENGIVHLVDLVILPLPVDGQIVEEASDVVGGAVVGIDSPADVTSVFDYETTYREVGAEDSVAI